MSALPRRSRCRLRNSSVDPVVDPRPVAEVDVAEDRIGRRDRGDHAPNVRNGSRLGFMGLPFK